MNAPRSAVIVGGNRTPFVKAGGAYAEASNLDLLTTALDGLAARFGLAGQQLDEVAGGAVLKHSADFNLTREAVLGSALAPTTPAVDLQQACGTGLETVIYLHNKISLGQAEVGIGAGVDSASDAPIVVTNGCVGPSWPPIAPRPHPPGWPPSVRSDRHTWSRSHRRWSNRAPG